MNFLFLMLLIAQTAFAMDPPCPQFTCYCPDNTHHVWAEHHTSECRRYYVNCEVCNGSMYYVMPIRKLIEPLFSSSNKWQTPADRGSNNEHGFRRPSSINLPSSSRERQSIKFLISKNSEPMAANKKNKKRKRQDAEADEKLGLSKSPVLDAVIFAVLTGLYAKPAGNIEDGVLTISNWQGFLNQLNALASNRKPNVDELSRAKALKRHFNKIPLKKNRVGTFEIIVKKKQLPLFKSCLKKIQEKYDDRLNNDQSSF